MSISDRHVNIKRTITELFICCLVDDAHCMFSIHKFRGVININITSDVLCIGIANVHDQLPIPYYNLWHGCVGN